MTKQIIDVERLHDTEANLLAGGCILGQKGIATDTHKQIHRLLDGSGYLEYSDDTNQILASGTNAFTGNQSLGGNNLTQLVGLLSDESIIFGIDEDNNGTSKSFTWRNNGSITLMSLLESGDLGLGTSSPDSTLHAHKATAGAVSAPADTVITAENSGNTYISLLSSTANGQYAGMFFNDTSNYLRMEYNTADVLKLNSSDTITLNSGSNMNIDSGGALTFSSNSSTVFRPDSTFFININYADADTSSDYFGIFEGTTSNILFKVLYDGTAGFGTTSPDCRLHVHEATAGAVSMPTNTIVGVENSTDAFLSFLTPSTTGIDQGLIFQDTNAALLYTPFTDIVELKNNNADGEVRISATASIRVYEDNGTNGTGIIIMTTAGTNGSVRINGTSNTASSPLNISGLPTSASGLSSGDVWNNSGVLTIV